MLLCGGTQLLSPSAFLRDREEEWLWCKYSIIQLGYMKLHNLIFRSANIWMQLLEGRSKQASMKSVCCLLSHARKTWNTFNHINGKGVMFLSIKCLKIDGLHTISRYATCSEWFAFSAKLWSGGISMGRVIPLNNSCLLFLGKALNSSSRWMPRVSCKLCTCCNWRWTVQEQDSAVATLLVDASTRLRGYVNHAHYCWNGTFYLPIRWWGRWGTRSFICLRA